MLEVVERVAVVCNRCGSTDCAVREIPIQAVVDGWTQAPKRAFQSKCGHCGHKQCFSIQEEEEECNSEK